MKKSLNWFNTIDRKIWGEKGARINPYIGTISIILIMILGVIAGAGDTFYDWFGWNTKVNMETMVLISLLIWGVNVLESYLAMPNKGAATARSLILLVTFAFAYFLGYVGTIFILLLLTVYIVVLIISGIVTIVMRNKNKKTADSSANNTDTISFTKQPDGRYLGSDSRYYKKEGDSFKLDQ